MPSESRRMTINDWTMNEPEEPPISHDQVNGVNGSERTQDWGSNVQERMMSGLGEAIPMHLAGLVRFHIICAHVSSD